MQNLQSTPNTQYIKYNAIEKKFDSALINPLYLKEYTQTVKTIIEQIENSSEAIALQSQNQSIKKQHAWFVWSAICTIFLVPFICFCIFLCTLQSAQEKQRKLASALKQRAQEICDQFNPTLNQQGIHINIMYNNEIVGQVVAKFLYLQVSIQIPYAIGQPQFGQPQSQPQPFAQQQGIMINPPQPYQYDIAFQPPAYN